MKIVGNQVTKEEAKMIERYVRRCIRHLSKKEYELDLPKNAADVAVRCLEVKRRQRSPSRAGRNLIRINLGYWQVGNRFHTEYASFDQDPTIGRIEVTEDADHWFVSIAHEVAHHVQYRYGPRIKRYKGTYKKPHGDAFKAIYRYLRRDLVNPIINAKVEQAYAERRDPALEGFLV